MCGWRKWEDRAQKAGKRKRIAKGFGKLKAGGSEIKP
jgi:hypothetical protein